VRIVALKFKILDMPHSAIKTHIAPTPYLGGVAIFIAFWVSIFTIRFVTSFPTGTLNSLRGILSGSVVIFLLGLIDDIKHRGLGFGTKLIIQTIASILLFLYGISIKFIHPTWFALFVSIIWVVGISNSLNIIDVMDGLASGVALIAALGFFLIGIPLEKEIYVNFVSIALIGACLGFIPYNLSKKYKIFMGDTGSLFLGFMLASISLGTKYTEVSNIGLFAPILILAIPIYETFLVTYFRWKKGMLPFLGSKDHFALRLERAGYSRKKIIILTYATGAVLSFFAFIVTIESFYFALSILISITLCAIFIGYHLSKIKVD
jgi:UDP-GlcNAc:undecaprenyl-phosphate GlcNAc-1-phosphate transferase